MIRQIFCAVAAFLVLFSYSITVWAKDWPSRPINIIVAYAPGGATDNLARIIANSLTQQLDRPVVVKNIPGANNILALKEAVSADPDYTFVMADSGWISGPASLGNHDYTKFVPISIFASSPAVLVRNPRVPANDLQHKVKTGQQITVATADLNLPATVWITDIKPLEVTPVPYKGSGPALLDVVAGHVDYASNGLLSSWPFINQKQVIPVMISAERRSPMLPNVPTYLELGFRGRPQHNWWGLLAHQNMQPKIMHMAFNLVNQTIKNNDRLQELKKSGLDINMPALSDSQLLYKTAMENQKVQ
jgi:tripartite-type tricarboxylate transporter receptor subunit TctC